MIPVSQLTLFPATKAQIEHSRRRTWEMWGRGRTVEEYLLRDLKTDEREVAKGGKLVTWILTKREDPTSLDFVSSCETFKRDGYISDPSSTTGKNVACYGIASVFTSPQHRRKGYAGHMMRLLHWVLAPEDALPVASFPVELWGECPKREMWGAGEGHGGDAEFSVLYSDVGREFYKGCGVLPGEEGWVCKEAISTVWNVEKVIGLEGGEVGEEWKWLDLDGLQEMWKIDATLLKTDMDAIGRAERACTFLPDKGVAEFQVLRQEHLWEKTGVTLWGVKKGDGLFASWTLDRNSDGSHVLLMTRVRAEREELEELIHVLAEFARRHNGINEIEAWGLSPELREKGRTSDREEHLPSIKCYRQEYDWHFNEKFCWC